MQANALIATILRHDAKTATYKIALIRSLNDLVLGYPDLADNVAAVAVPLRLLAAQWIGYYWPFVDPNAPIKQGRHSASKQDIAFRPALTALRALWTELAGASRPADGFFLNSELLTEHRRRQYPAEMGRAHDAAVSAIVHALRQPIRYAGPGEHTVFPPPRSWAEIRHTNPGVVPVPETASTDRCVVVAGEMWRGLRELSLWVEALCIHEWCLLTEAIAGIDRGVVYSLLTDRPDNRRPLTWERNCVELLMLEGRAFRCPWTEKLLTPTSYDLDHLVPISVYPLNELWNLVPAEPKFNEHVKRDRLPSDARLESARPHLVMAYAHYTASPELAPVLRQDAGRRFDGDVQAADFPDALAARTVSYLRTVTVSRNLSTF